MVLDLITPIQAAQRGLMHHSHADNVVDDEASCFRIDWYCIAEALSAPTDTGMATENKSS